VGFTEHPADLAEAIFIIEGTITCTRPDGETIVWKAGDLIHWDYEEELAVEFSPGMRSVCFFWSDQELPDFAKGESGSSRADARGFEADHRLPVAKDVSLQKDDVNSHNRWHPDIPPVLRIESGDTVDFEFRDAFDLAIGPAAGGDALGGLELGREHPLTGPVYVEGAEPGDVLEVELLSFTPAERAFSMVFPGFNILPERMTEPVVTHWDIEDGVARCPAIPGVSFRGAPFLGTAGVAPSAERLAKIARREADLAAEGAPVLQPTAEFAVPAGLGSIGAEGLRTMPAREVGGNLDVPEFGVGTVVSYPVDVAGALFSAGDPHFRQGDGEVSGGALEMSATAVLRFNLVKAADAAWVPPTPAAVRRSPAEPEREWLLTTGIPVTADGINRYRDVTLAACNAVETMVDRVAAEYGYAPWQAFTIVSLATRIQVSAMVDTPNVTVTASLPTDVFESER
jgi:formamidase